MKRELVVQLHASFERLVHAEEETGSNSGWRETSEGTRI